MFEKNILGDTPFHYACMSNENLEIIKFLLKNCGKGDIKKTLSEILIKYQKDKNLIKKYSEKNLKKIYLDEKNILMIQNNYGDIALHLACSSNRNLEIIKFLVKESEDFLLDLEDCHGHKPFHYAFRFNENVEICKFLIMKMGKRILDEIDQHGKKGIEYLGSSKIEQLKNFL